VRATSVSKSPVYALKGFLPLVRRQLSRAAQVNAAGFGARSVLFCCGRKSAGHTDCRDGGF
jgi:hypothetical protein